jgi:hypothetical protein
MHRCTAHSTRTSHCPLLLPLPPTQDGEYVSGNQSLWQITEAPAMLSAEPLVMRDAARLAGAVREMIPHLEARVKAAFGKAKESKVQVGRSGSRTRAASRQQLVLLMAAGCVALAAAAHMTCA